MIVEITTAQADRMIAVLKVYQEPLEKAAQRYIIPKQKQECQQALKEVNEMIEILQKGKEQNV